MATYNGQVTGGGLNLREKASTGATRLTQIPNNTKIVVSDYSGNSSWYCTTYGSYSGFVMKEYVNILSNVTSQSATVTGGGLNLREYPSTSAQKLIQIPDKKSIVVQKHNDTWCSTTYDGHSGFVMTQYLSIGGSTGGDSGETGNTTLKKGSTGAEVTKLQNKLTGLLYYCGSVDGSFGQQTYLAVKYFQERNGLSVDGIVGSGTWGKLNSSSAVKGVGSDVLSWKATNEPITYYQNNGFWSSYPYDATETSTVETVGTSACGPTSMAIVASTLLKKAIIPPILSDWALSNNCRDHAGVNGTYFSFFKKCAQNFGLTYGGTLTDKTTATFNKIKEWCEGGGLAIINAYSSSPYTDGGHYIVCYKVSNDIVYIKDCNYKNRNLANHTVSEWITKGSNGKYWFGDIALIK